MKLLLHFFIDTPILLHYTNCFIISLFHFFLSQYTFFLLPSSFFLLISYFFFLKITRSPRTGVAYSKK